MQARLRGTDAPSERKDRMNGVHDMGGMHGFGPIDIEIDEPVFHEEWEGRVYGMVTSIREEHDVYGPYGSRHYIENIPPARYLASSYYEKWMRALEAALLNKGLITAEELEARTREFGNDPTVEVPRRADPEFAERVRRGIYAPQHLEQSAASPPRFAVGDAIGGAEYPPDRTHAAASLCAGEARDHCWRLWCAGISGRTDDSRWQSTACI